MTHLIVCLIVWITVLLAIPFKRIQELRSVLIVSFLWMLLLNNIFVSLGYYSYHNMILPFGRVPLFQLLAYGGIGMLMIN